MSDNERGQSSTVLAALRPVDAGRWDVTTDPRFWNQIGPFGGWLAAVALQAMRAELAPAYQPRSCTIHFFGALAAGDIRIEVKQLRVMRTVAALRAELSQQGKVAVSADCIFGQDRDGPALGELSPPAMSPPENYPRWRGLDPLARFTHEFDYRLAFGAPFTKQASSESGGWVRLVQGGEHSPEHLMLLADAWYPAAWPLLSDPVPVSTLSMTVLFHPARDPQSIAQGDFMAARFSTQRIANGYGDERGELWWPDGSLALASQQLVWIDFAKAHKRVDALNAASP